MVMTELDPSESPRAFVGAMVRKLRLAAGLTAEDLGKLVHLSESAILMIERGERTATADFLEKCDPALNAGGWLLEMRPLVRHNGHPSWFRPWVEIEKEAHTLRTWQPLLIPGLLQTEGYMRALLRKRPSLTETDTDELVSARLDRQTILDRDPPPCQWVVLDEGVLHRLIGDTKIMHDQLGSLADATRRPNVSVQVVPANAQATPGLNGAFVIATVRAGPDTVYLDSAAEGHVTDRPEDVAEIFTRYEAIRADALPAQMSLELIEKAMEEEWAQS